MLSRRVKSVGSATCDYVRVCIHTGLTPFATIHRRPNRTRVAARDVSWMDAGTVVDFINYSRKAYLNDNSRTCLECNKPARIDQTLDQKLSHQENLTQGLLTVINQQSQTMVNNLTTMQNHFNHMFSNHSWSINELMWNEIRMLASKNDLPRSKIDSGEHPQAVTFRSCKENPSQLSGKYIIQSTEDNEPFLVYCEQTAFAGGWLVFQHRYDGSVGFYRNWTEYRDGFGSIDEEFWLGLEQLHRLTSARMYELLVELKDFSGNYIYARYDEFAIGSEAQQYQLTKLGSYSGTNV
uniref:Fibrinogen C-terminal domain-containing protein n=1 Tax=Anopheles merus TaxID=30066 RepID=A0A182VF16_ANOME